MPNTISVISHQIMANLKSKFLDTIVRNSLKTKKEL